MRTITSYVLIIIFVISNYLNAQDWQVVGGGTNGPVRALCEYNGQLIIAGDFTKAGDNEIALIAAWNGKEYTQLGQGLDDLNTQGIRVRALFVYDSLLWVGGTMGYNDTARHLMTWNGNEWSVPEQPNGPVYAIEKGDIGTIIIGGQFTRIGNLPANNHAYYDPFSSQKWMHDWNTAWSWDSSQTNIYDQTKVTTLEYHYNGLWAGGLFENDGINGRHVAWHSRVWYKPDDNGWQPTGSVVDMKSFNDKLYISGSKGLLTFEYRSGKLDTIKYLNSFTSVGGAMGVFNSELYVSGYAPVEGFHIKKIDKNEQVSGTRKLDFRASVNVIYEFGGELYVGGEFDEVSDLEDGKNKRYHHIVKLSGAKTAVSNELISAKDIVLWPNPARRHLIIDLGEVSASSIKLTSLTGNDVVSMDGAFRGEQMILTSDYPQGMYILNVVTNNGIINKRVSIVK